MIRAAAPRDLPGLVGMCRGGVQCDLPETLLGAYTPLKGLAHALWLPLRLSRRRVRTYLARCAGEPCAFVQVRGGAAPHKWDVLYLGATGRGPLAAGGGRVDLWTALLDYTTGAAGRRGIRRIYAKLPSGVETGDVAEAFRAAGYSRYGEETIYLLRGGAGGSGVATGPGGQDGMRLATADLAEAAVTLRPQTPVDTWALHQLYNWTAPKPVQYAEAYTSHHWELTGQGRLRPRGALREWGLLFERDHEIAIYCRVGRQGNRTRLAFVFDPQERVLLGPAVRALVHWLAPERGEWIYCSVQEFQQELASPLEAHGFQRLGVQELLVRHTTVAVRAPAMPARPALEKLRAGVPAT